MDAYAWEGPYRARWLRRLVVAVLVLLLSGVVSRVSSRLIGVWFPDRPLPRDLLFERLPYLPWTQYLTDIAVLVAIVLGLVYAFRGRTGELPKMVALFGIMELLRAFIILLTPLAGPLGNGAYYGLIHMVQNGEFPSGHAASVLLCLLLVDREQAPRLRAVLAALVVVEIASLLLSHGHYSIDIVGGLLLSYFVYHEFAPRLWRG